MWNLTLCWVGIIGINSLSDWHVFIYILYIHMFKKSKKKRIYIFVNILNCFVCPHSLFFLASCGKWDKKIAGLAGGIGRQPHQDWRTF